MKNENEYRYWAQYFYPGVNYGIKRLFAHGITLNTRVGYGIPIEISPWTWDTSPDEANVIEAV